MLSQQVSVGRFFRGIGGSEPAGIVSAGINAFYTQLCFGLVIIISVVLQTIIDRKVRKQSITSN